MQADKAIIPHVKVEVALSDTINEADAAMTMLDQAFDCLVCALNVVHYQRGERWMVGVYQHRWHISLPETRGSFIIRIEGDHQQPIDLVLSGQRAKVGLTLLIGLHIVQHKLSL